MSPRHSQTHCSIIYNPVQFMGSVIYSLVEIKSKRECTDQTPHHTHTHHLSVSSTLKLSELRPASYILPFSKVWIIVNQLSNQSVTKISQHMFSWCLTKLMFCTTWNEQVILWQKKALFCCYVATLPSLLKNRTE